MVRERDVLPAKREGGAVDGGERRPELVRDGRDEVGLELFDCALGGEVAEGEDCPALEADSGDRQPELAAVDLDRLGLGPELAALRKLRDRLPR